MNADKTQEGPLGASGPSGPPAGQITDSEAAQGRRDALMADIMTSGDAWQRLAACLVSGESVDGLPLSPVLLDAVRRWQAGQAALIENVAAGQAAAASEIADLKAQLSAVRAALPKIRSVYDDLIRLAARMETNDFLAGAMTPAYMLRAQADGLHALYVNLMGKIGGA